MNCGYRWGACDVLGYAHRCDLPAQHPGPCRCGDHATSGRYRIASTGVAFEVLDTETREAPKPCDTYAQARWLVSHLNGETS